jgi:AmmeMemoRadiSam system protein B
VSRVRQAAFADDRWYPSTEEALHNQVDNFLDSGEEPESVIALMAPHAGYFYSGRVAGAVYSAVKVPDRVIVVAPNHRGIGARRSVMTHGYWRIPGLDIPIDTDAATTLKSLAPGLIDDDMAHSQEHSLEVQLPFLSRRNPNMKLVPMCLFPQRLEDCRALGAALADTVKTLPGDTLLVASSDMNHYESAAVGNAKDKRAIERVLALDPDGLYRTVRSEDISMCGMVPTTIVLYAALALGAGSARLVKYADSGDANHDKSSVVGYAGISIR